MNKCICILFLTLFSLPISSMIQIADKRYRLDKRSLRRNMYAKKVIPLPQQRIKRKFCSEPSLLGVLQQKIITIECLCCAYSDVKAAAKLLSALAQTNNFLNKLINDQDKALELIRNLSVHFQCPNMMVAQTLCTQAGYHRYLIQQSISINVLQGCRSSWVDLNKASAKGLDVNFTDCGSFKTPLIQTINSLGLHYGMENMISWLIDKGAHINQSSMGGKNAMMWAIESYKKKAIKLFLNHQSLDVHHTDVHNNTLLHYCITTMLNKSDFDNKIFIRKPEEYDFMLGVIKQLIEKGLNPTLKNNSGKTALEYAQAESGQGRPHLHYKNMPSGDYRNIIPEKLINLLKRAEEKWKSSRFF